jgi:hypothetical protein
MMDSLYKNSLIFLLITALLFISSTLLAQEAQLRIIQLNGVVLGEDSLDVPGAHVYIPASKRGTTTNMYGFFTMPALEGDSIVISSVGYKKFTYVIPKTTRESITRVFQLELDTAYLEEVQIFPFPATAQAFKEAILAMDLPSEYRNIQKTLSPDELKALAEQLPAGAYSNYRYAVYQQQRQWQYQYGGMPNPLLNPFAWNQLIRSIKRGDLKNDN